MLEVKIEEGCCVNCGSVCEDEAVHQFSISFTPVSRSEEGRCNEDIKPDSAEALTNVSILDALLSIFASSPLINIKESSTSDLAMCFKCASVLSTFYQSYMELLSLSTPLGVTRMLVPLVKLWQDLEPEEERDPFAVFIQAILLDSGNLDRPTEESKQLFPPLEEEQSEDLEAYLHNLQEDDLGRRRSSRIAVREQQESNFLKEISCKDEGSALAEEPWDDPAETIGDYSMRVDNRKQSTKIAATQKIIKQRSKTAIAAQKKIQKRRSDLPVEATKSDAEAVADCIPEEKQKKNKTANRKIQKQRSAPPVEDCQNRKGKKAVLQKKVKKQRLLSPSLLSGNDTSKQVETGSNVSKVVAPSHKRPDPKLRQRRIGPYRKYRKPECTVEGCNMKFPWHWALKMHVLQYHENKSPEKCHCGFSSVEPFFQLHICLDPDTMKRVRKRLRCRCCGLPLKTEDILRRHHANHDRSILKCSFPPCSRSFKQIEALEAHEQIRHVNPRKFPCKECGKLLKSAPTLRVHMNSVHCEERRFLCTECGMSFKRQYVFTKHLFVHKNLSELSVVHSCKICGKGFKIKKYLTDHYKSKVHPKSLVEKVLRGEKLGEDELKNSTLRRTRTKKNKPQLVVDEQPLNPPVPMETLDTGTCITANPVATRQLHPGNSWSSLFPIPTSMPMWMPRQDGVTQELERNGSSFPMY